MAEKTKRQIRYDEILELTHQVADILLKKKVDGKFDVFLGKKPYLIEVTFSANLLEAGEIVKQCEELHGLQVELEPKTSPMLSPCTVKYDYVLDITVF